MTNIHPQLKKDSFILGQFKLCTLLLVNDANYPWFILVPQVKNFSELHQLTIKNQQQYLIESMFFSQCLETIFKPDKINIASLGNVVPQLHIHHVARFKTDACWPAPIWGAKSSISYGLMQIETIKQQLAQYFSKRSELNFTWY